MESLPATIAYPFRHQRAQALTGHIMNLIGKHLERHEGKAHRDASRALFELFYESGVEVITDADREAAGLPKRDEQGLTREELHIMEAQRMEIMLRPMPPIFVTPKTATHST